MNAQTTSNPETDGGRGRDSAPPLVDRTDLAITLVILALCGWLYWVTTTFGEVPAMLGENLGPEAFPRLLLWTIGLLSLGLPFEQYLQYRRTRVRRKRAEGIKLISIVTAGLLIVVVASMKIIGTVLSMVAVCVLLPLLWGERRIWLVLPFAVIFPAAVTALFSGLLGVYFEPGVLLGGLFG